MGAVLETGDWGSAPVFAIARDAQLWGDWDPVRLYPLVGDPPLDFVGAAHFLASSESGYSSTTMLPGVLMQTGALADAVESGRGLAAIVGRGVSAGGCAARAAGVETGR